MSSSPIPICSSFPVPGDGALVFTGGQSSIVPTSSLGTGSSVQGGTTPVQQVNMTIAASTPVTVAYSSYTPALSFMQTIASQSISATKSGSSFNVCFCVKFQTATAQQAMGLQIAVFSSVSTTTPLTIHELETNALSANANFQQRVVTLRCSLPSQGVGVPVTFYLAAGTSQNLPTSQPIIISTAGGSLCYITEEIPNVEQVVSSTVYNIGSQGALTSCTALYSSTSQAYSTMTSLLTLTAVKKLSNTFLNISGTLNYQGTVANSPYFVSTSLFAASGSSVPAATTPSYNVNCGGNQINTAQGSFTINSFDTIILPSVLSAGTYSLAIAGASQSSTNVARLSNGFYSSVAVTEYSVLSDSTMGRIQNVSLNSISQGTVTVLTTTLTPTYSQVTPLGTPSPVVCDSSTSNLYVQGNFQIGSGAGGAEACILLCFYTSNASSATPVATFHYSTSSSTSFNSGSTSWAFTIPSVGATNTVTFYIGAAYTSTNSAGGIQISVQPFCSEINLVSSSNSITSVTSNDTLLTSTTSSGAVTLDLTTATTSSGGLLATASPLAINTVARVNNTGALATTTQPGAANFGASIRIASGGASTGQVVGTQSGSATYITASIPVTQTALAAPAFWVKVTFTINITTIGTSTGVLTLVGMPIPSAQTFFTYSQGGNITGITLPTNGALYFGFTAGSAIITINSRSSTTGVITQLTNTALTAPVTGNLLFDVPTLTAPTN